MLWASGTARSILSRPFWPGSWLLLLLLSQIFNHWRSQPFHGLGSAEPTFSLFSLRWHSLLAGLLRVCPVCDQPKHTLSRDPPWPSHTARSVPPGTLSHHAQKQFAKGCSLNCSPCFYLFCSSSLSLLPCPLFFLKSQSLSSLQHLNQASQP